MSPSRLCRRAARVARTEGPVGLLSRSVRFLRYNWGRVFCVERVYVCRFELAELDSWPSPLVPAGFKTHMIASHGDADALAAQGYEDLRERILRARRSLDTGAAALCAYDGRRLAHVGWTVCDSLAKLRFDDVPYTVDFESGEACLGSVYTFPEYRGRGLAPYSTVLRLKYLRSLGYRAVLLAVRADNVASLRANARVGPHSRRAALHVKLPGINYLRYSGAMGDAQL